MSTKVEPSSSDSKDEDYGRLPTTSNNGYGLALFYNLHVDLTSVIKSNATTVHEKLLLDKKTWPMSFENASLRDVCAIGFTTDAAMKHSDVNAEIFDITVALLKLNKLKATGDIQFCAPNLKLGRLQPSSVTILPYHCYDMCTHAWQLAGISGKKIGFAKFYATSQHPPIFTRIFTTTRRCPQ